ncbi:MAG TPA: DinB family protein [Bryobacterales bacterium]|nr:DinB family protein [Bryobacterales bacterium]
MKLLGCLLLLTSAALPQTPNLKSASGYPKMVQKQVTAWIERAAEKMPEEEYAFKPDPAVRSFGQILGHIADANYLFCAPVLGENNPSPGIEKTKTTKAELTSTLHDAFAYCNRAYDALTDAGANETVKAFGQQRNKLGVLWFNASHNLEHYGNLVVYMRLKGIVPPSSDRKPQ